MLDALSDDQIAHLAYLIILLTVLVFYALVAKRRGLSRVVRGAVLWVLLFIGALSAYDLWLGARFTLMTTQSSSGESVTLRRGFDGHFRVSLRVTGADGVERHVPFLVDTGASEMVLTRQDAEMLGFDTGSLPFEGVARTANGETRTAEISLDRVVLADDQAISDVRALVNSGDLHASLLGMSFLSHFARIEISGNVMRIVF